MSMNSAHNRLARADKDFCIRWDQTLQLWRDEVARQYNDQFIGPLLVRGNAVHKAMVHLESVLTALRHDCE